mgnify:CR=1 FL=1
MIMAITADAEVSKRVTRAWRDVETTKRSRKWNDDVSAMHKVIQSEGAMSYVMEVFSKPRVNGMADRLKIFPGA